MIATGPANVTAGACTPGRRAAVDGMVAWISSPRLG